MYGWAVFFEVQFFWTRTQQGHGGGHGVKETSQFMQSPLLKKKTRRKNRRRKSDNWSLFLRQHKYKGVLGVFLIERSKALSFPHLSTQNLFLSHSFCLVRSITILPLPNLASSFASPVSSQVVILPDISWQFFFVLLLSFLFPFVCRCQSISPHCGNLPAWYCNLPFPNKLSSPTYVLLPVTMTPAKILHLLLFFLKHLPFWSLSICLVFVQVLKIFPTSRVPHNCWPQAHCPLKERNEEERELADPWVIRVCSASGFLSPSLPGYNGSQIGHFLIRVAVCLLGWWCAGSRTALCRAAGSGHAGALSRGPCLQAAKLHLMKNPL